MDGPVNGLVGDSVGGSVGCILFVDGPKIDELVDISSVGCSVDDIVDKLVDELVDGSVVDILVDGSVDGLFDVSVVATELIGGEVVITLGHSIV